MIVLAKLILGICFSYIAENNTPQKNNEYTVLTTVDSYAVKDSIKTKAFEVLTNKCNVCHKRRNRYRVFTEDNMNGWSKDVYVQVFVKKRMPKGRRIKLTEEEYKDLETWISTVKNKN
ncbi:hypothetical protein [uncultured Tenacibaculum sp.]|uniref:hypothetical protein n=1 Tax=uncultured Tenacibaculum sp. TaxID=174713 RepID=UPI002628A4A3|nr:hypothetical protein [uncultured Tenacibaculum sp.]